MLINISISSKILNEGFIMEKIAQKRSILNKLREMTNVSGIAAEKFFNPEFKRVMESLREKDDEIRSLVAGTAIGVGDPGDDPVALKDIVKAAKSSLNRREYMLAVSDLGRFHRKMSEIAQRISSLNFDIDKVHHEFLFGSKDKPILEDEHKERLQYLKNRFAQQHDILVKQAGIMDFFYNIGTKRGRALAAWEKRYPEKAKPLAKQTGIMLNQSEILLEKTLVSLKEMAAARAVRNVDAYMKAASSITKIYDKYHKSFGDYYRGVVQPLIKDMDLMPPTPATPTKEVDPLLTAPSSGSVPTLQQGPTGTMPQGPALNALIPGPPSAPHTIVAPTVDDPDPDSSPPTLRSGPPPMTPAPGGTTIPPDPTTLKSSEHKDFFNSLKSLSKENPLVLASHIANYARSIQDTDPSIAINLFKVARSIKRK